MTDLTPKEIKVLRSFETYPNVADTVHDLGVSWTDVKELAVESALTMRTVKGVVGSLEKKGLIVCDNDDDQKNPAIALDVAGVEALVELEKLGEQEAAEDDAAKAAAEPKPATKKARMLDMLRGDGTTLEIAADFLQVSKPAARSLLQDVRRDGHKVTRTVVVSKDGKERVSVYKLA